MEKTISGTFPVFLALSEVVNSDDVRVSKKQITDTGDNSSSAHALLTNDDLLIEILLRLPVISIIIFKLVSKRWFSLISSPDFIMRRNQIPNVDHPSGLFLQRLESSNACDFMSLDSRIPSRKSLLRTAFTLGSSEAISDEILQSCNGLLLCRRRTRSYSYFDMLYVFNPSTNLFKVLSQHDILNLKLTFVCVGMRMAFDPAKSPYYKVVHAGRIDDDEDNMQIQTYSSETCNWSVSAIQAPPQALHWWNKRLFVSRGCLLHLRKEQINSQEFSIYEMRKGNSEWSVKYHVNADDFIFPFPNTWTVNSTIWSIVLGEREEDSFMVVKLSGKVVEYKFLSKTLRKLYDLGSTKDTLIKYEFIASFASV